MLAFQESYNQSIKKMFNVKKIMSLDSENRTVAKYYEQNPTSPHNYAHEYIYSIRQGSFHQSSKKKLFRRRFFLINSSQAKNSFAQ